MFQTFDDESSPAFGAGRVAALREKIAAEGLTGFVVPRSDEHQGEYVAPGSERLKWLTGFTGSAGIALILKDKAVVFVDGRYTLQVRHQVDLDVFSIDSLVANPPPNWIRKNLGKGARIGFDPWLHTISEVKALSEALEGVGGELVAVSRNLVDAIWTDRPAPPLGKVSIQDIAQAGVLASDKLPKLAEAIAAAGATHAVLTDPSSLAWAFNIRGSDVPHTPLALGFAVLGTYGKSLIYLDDRKLSIKTRAYLTQLADLRSPDALEGDLAELGRGGAKIALDPVLAAEKLRLVVTQAGGTVIEAPDPARIPRATKNAAEIAGTRAAHRRDGAAVAKMLCWLARREPGTIDEVKAVESLEEFRRVTGEETQMPLRDVSFATIAGAGPNGAIMHYRVTRATNRNLGDGELFLLDSGGQYQDGTTDITRTIPIGTPTDEMRQRYTLVLKGMIQISLARFPVGTRGCDLDTLARTALWRHGFDFAHGTGHGVGSYLSVHEGPQRIARSGTQVLLEGMILSNEPGYYKEGAYGIRIENLVLVTAPEVLEGGDIATHGFETLTLAPLEQRLIAHELLNKDELRFIDDYHQRVLAEIGPMLDGETLTWLETACRPLAILPH